MEILRAVFLCIRDSVNSSSLTDFRFGLIFIVCKNRNVAYNIRTICICVVVYHFALSFVPSLSKEKKPLC